MPGRLYSGEDRDDIDERDGDQVEQDGNRQRVADHLTDGALAAHALAEAGGFEADLPGCGETGASVFHADGRDLVEPASVLDDLGFLQAVAFLVIVLERLALR